MMKAIMVTITSHRVAGRSLTHQIQNETFNTYVYVFVTETVRGLHLPIPEVEADLADAGN